ncbi:MAG: hypothetical protein Q8S39_06355 [Ignavibacteria bacterium]|nr:hypothetical protein [Ignavibacteria bacterium]MDP3581538.1 hypothetical protein [Ignavibacteria bacterium]
MKKSLGLIFVVFLSAIMFSSCKNEEGDSLLLPEETPPVIALNTTTESFSYSIVAVKYTKQEVYNLQVVSDSIRISYATNSITSGQMEILVELKDGTKLVTRNLSGVLAANDYKKIKSLLSKVTLNYSNFTGQFALSLNTAS